ncbi:DDE superfamily endonuclease domain,Homeobox domain-like [Cinara cedri]|uniref:DDE superfamily endonuclease domain,Homeobox domain-like n=1 Tax=Cinara cedri TaxID=506608 RepID=A0A5E4NKB9_9HEMI|nr:DDE superfamily endonuclease domain,Homeobox domain-like [Cinara cedri]
MGPTVKRKQFSLKEKKNIISEVDKGLKKGEVAKKVWHISINIVNHFEEPRKQLETTTDLCFCLEQKKMRKAQFEDVDTAVFKWFQDVRSRNVPLTASFGWLNRFRERYSVVTKCISGVNEWRNGEVAALINKYSPNDVSNVDEAEVFFQLEPKRTLAQKGDKCVGSKASKQRITALFCYFDKEMEKKNRKILRLIDNCEPHNEPPKLENIRVEYFPPNCTAVVQPLNQGIIKAVKSRYRTFL